MSEDTLLHVYPRNYCWHKLVPFKTSDRFFSEWKTDTLSASLMPDHMIWQRYHTSNIWRVIILACRLEVPIGIVPSFEKNVGYWALHEWVYKPRRGAYRDHLRCNMFTTISISGVIRHVPIESEECVFDGVKCTPIKSRHVIVMAIVVIVPRTSLSVFITYTQRTQNLLFLIWNLSEDSQLSQKSFSAKLKDSQLGQNFSVL